jgi:hypothetical protein
VSSGITTKLVGGTRVRVFTPEKSIADCFKFRNKIGIDVGIEALRNYLSLRTKNVDQLLRYAEIDRVGSVIRPYVEALLG